MKRITVILLSLVMVSSAFAGMGLGVKLGANYSYIEGSELTIDQFEDIENITGFVGGGFLNIGPSFLQLQAEALFSMEGFSLANPDSTIQNTVIRTNYLNVPILARLNFDLPVVAPFIYGGINIGIPLDTQTENQEIDLNDFDFNSVGLTFGAGVKVLGCIDVDLRFVKGVTDIYTQETDDTDETFANLVRLSVGLYLF